MAKIQNKYNYIPIPFPLSLKLNTLFPNELDLSRACGLLRLIMAASHKAEDPRGYVTIPSQTFQNRICHAYKKYMNILIEAFVVERDGIYHEGKAFGYRIAKNARRGDLTIKKFKQIKRKHKKRTCYDTLNVLKKISLTIDKKVILEFVKAYVTPEYVRSSIEVDNEINEKWFPNVRLMPEDQKNLSNVTFKRALQFAKAEGLSIIRKDRKRIVIQDLCEFILDHVYFIRESYAAKLLTFINKNSYAFRNDTNDRLETDITNLKSEFLAFVRLKGEKLMQWDLCNSQFIILTYVLEDLTFFDSDVRINSFKKIRIKKGYSKEIEIKTDKRVLSYYLSKSDITNSKPAFCKDGFLTFSKAAKAGNLYEVMALRYNARHGTNYTREDVKSMMFVLAFSKARSNVEGKKLFKDSFPEVAKYIYDYKMKHGYKELPIDLQKLEAKVFIDGILKELFKKGLLVLSRHDSILCRESDNEKVGAIMKNYLDKVFGPGQYTLKNSGFEEIKL